MEPQENPGWLRPVGVSVFIVWSIATIISNRNYKPSPGDPSSLPLQSRLMRGAGSDYQRQKDQEKFRDALDHRVRAEDLTPEMKAENDKYLKATRRPPPKSKPEAPVKPKDQ